MIRKGKFDNKISVFKLLIFLRNSVGNKNLINGKIVNKNNKGLNLNFSFEAILVI